MTLIFPALLLLILIACVAFLYREGMWTNAVNLINVVTAALLAVNFWEPLARVLEGYAPSLTYFWDFIALWALFVLFMLVFKTATNAVSGYRVQFKKIVDQIGSAAFAVLIGWVMVCFITMTLHTAPLKEKFLWGGFNPEKRMFFKLAPDRQLLGLVHYLASGSLRRWNKREFDPDYQFIQTYRQRRAEMEKYAAVKKAFRITGQSIDKR